MPTLLIFILLNVVNVVLSTIKSIVTIKGGKWLSAIINGVTFYVYTYVIIYMSCDLNIHSKAILVGFINIVAVFLVKLIEEKNQKKKMWKIELTVPKSLSEKFHTELKHFNISHNFIDVDKWTVFNCYTQDKNGIVFVKALANQNKAKYFITETEV